MIKISYMKPYGSMWLEFNMEMIYSMLNFAYDSQFNFYKSYTFCDDIDKNYKVPSLQKET